jgi:hypothetical protein
MEEFKQYIQNCIASKTDILVKMYHLDSINFEDICMLIYIKKAEKLSVLLSWEVKDYLRISIYDSYGMITILGVHNKEELAILPYIAKPTGNFCAFVLHDFSNPALISPYTMSDNFLNYSQQYGVAYYEDTQNIIKLYEIKHDSVLASKYFAQYMSIGPKSARNI